jgi:drug/metabolite transporter (DMT)-like permease
MSRTAVAVTTGLAAAVAFGIASAVQHDQARQVARGNPLNPDLIGRLAKRPVWLLGMVADASAVALQAVALRFGAVVLVQLLVVGGLPVAVVLSAVLARARLGRPEITGLVLCTGGLALAVPGTTSVNLGHPAGAGAWLLVTVLVTAAVLGLVLLAQRRKDLAPAATGIAAGISAGASSVLLAICAARIDHPLALLRTVVPYVALALGMATLLLSQAAFQTGALGTPLAALSVTEPAVAVLLAVTVLHEHLPVAPGPVTAAVVGAAAAVAGVLVLSRSARLAVAEPAPL